MQVPGADPAAVGDPDGFDLHFRAQGNKVGERLVVLMPGVAVKATPGQRDATGSPSRTATWAAWAGSARLPRAPRAAQFLPGTTDPLDMPLVHVPEGHLLQKCMQTSTNSEVYLAVREADGQEVILKAYRHCQQEELRVSVEFELLRRVAGPGIPRALAVLPARADAAPTLVLERVPGVQLQHWAESGVSAAAFLEVSIQLAHALTRIHMARLIHRDISAANVLVDARTLQTHLIDFGLTRPLGAGLHSGSAHSGEDGGAGTLLYLSPEQTGRMDRGVDPRSDLYSLGACLYYALTGRPPFAESDPLALIHAHFARIPVAPIELRPDLPSTLSRIVLKLLQKSPEDRYQTADALRVDLDECRRQLQTHGSIANDLPLATADVPYRPLFSSRLYGRDLEVQQILSAYTRAATGSPVLTLVRGAPGAGKTALVQVLRAPLTQAGGHLVQGKFDAYRRDKPYAGFGQAFASLADQLLTESDAALASWRERLNRSVGAIAGALLELAPNLALVLGDLPPLPALGNLETRARLVLAVQRFVRTLAAVEHPLVLVLDDLQWADEASRELLRELLMQSGESALMVLGIYRDSEVDTHHPLTRVLADLGEQGLALEPISLGPLELEPCAQMLAAALGRPVEQTRGLATCVARKTGSAPLLIQQFVHHMYDLGLIHFQVGTGWTWDDAQIAAADIPDDAVALMTAKISRLGTDLTQALQLASCCGDVFDLDMLLELSEESTSKLETSLFRLCDEGLLAPAPAGFRFSHDRIREAALALLPARERARLHSDAGQLLLARTEAGSLAERALEIADHLNHGAELLPDEALVRAIELNIMAGKQTLQAGASATAAAYFASARRLHERAGDPNPVLMFELLFFSAEAAYQTRDLALARELLDQLDRQPLVRMQAGLVVSKRIAVDQLDPSGQGVQLVIDSLRRFGVRWPLMPSRLRTRLAIAQTDWSLRRPLDQLHPAPPAEHPRWAPVLLTFAAGGGAMTMKSVRHTLLMAAFVARIYYLRGYIMSPALVLAAYAAFRLGYLRHLRGADRYAQAALTWADRVAHIPFSARARYVVHAFVHAWTKPRRAVLEPLRQDCETLLEIGDIEYAYYAALQRTGYMALCGELLPLVQREYESMGARLQRPTERHVLALERLRDPTANPEQLRKDVRALQLASDSPADDAMQAWAFWLGILCILGHHAEASAIAESIRERVLEVGSTVSQLADHAFFAGICVAAAAEGHRERKQARRILRGHLRQLRVWARIGPDFRHMVCALEAEQARLVRDDRSALARYAEAATAAAEAGHRHHAALLHERRGELLHRLRRSTESASAYGHAISLYEEWGAHAKATQLRAQVKGLGLRKSRGSRLAASASGPTSHG